jgi:hypothetical protein
VLLLRSSHLPRGQKELLCTYERMLLWIKRGRNPARRVATSILRSHPVQLRTNETWRAKSAQQLLHAELVVSSSVFEVDVPPVSGLSAFLAYAYEFLLVGILMCMGPPLALIACSGSIQSISCRRPDASPLPPYHVRLLSDRCCC